MKDAKNKSQCTNIGPEDDYSCCEFNGEYINEKYLPIYNLLNYPSEKISDLTSSGYIAKCMQQCENRFEPAIENGVCTHKSVPFENRSRTLDSPDK